MLHTHRGTAFAVLPGPENIAGIRKEGRQLDRARVLIHLAIRKIERTRMRILRPVSQNELQLPARRTGIRKLFSQSKILLLADSEIVSDRVERGKRRQCATARAHQTANLRL